MKTSEQCDQVYAAMFNVIGTLMQRSLGKSADAGGRYRYVPLDDVIDYVLPVCFQHGLVIIQAPISNSPGMIGVTTRVAHVASQQWLESTIEFPIVELRGQNPYQACGSALSYIRRYALITTFGLKTEDTDAGGSTGQWTQPGTPGGQQSTPPRGLF
jgi:hypothetical protein